MSNNLSFQRINVEKPPDVFNCWWDEWERLCAARPCPHQPSQKTRLMLGMKYWCEKSPRITDSSKYLKCTEDSRPEGRAALKLGCQRENVEAQNILLQYWRKQDRNLQPALGSINLPVICLKGSEFDCPLPLIELLQSRRKQPLRALMKIVSSLQVRTLTTGFGVSQISKCGFCKCQGHRDRDSQTGSTAVWGTIPTILEAAGCVAHVILMFYSCRAYYGSQKSRSESLLAEIFNPIPTCFTPPTA